MSLEGGTEWENESSGKEDDEYVGFDEEWSNSESYYTSDSSAESSLPDSPIPEDTNSKSAFVKIYCRNFSSPSNKFLQLHISSSSYKKCCLICNSRIQPS